MWCRSLSRIPPVPFVRSLFSSSSSSSSSISISSLSYRRLSTSPSSVPLLSLSTPRSTLVSSLASACQHHGFFYIRVKDEDIHKHEAIKEKAFQQCHALFSLPSAIKHSLKQNRWGRGYTSLGAETLDPTKSTRGDTKEGYYIGRDYSLTHPWVIEGKPLHGPNVYPPSTLLPEFRSVMETYYQYQEALALELVSLLSDSLSLPPSTWKSRGHFDAHMGMLRLLHYTPDRSQPEHGVYAAGAHADYGMVTILATDSVPGLQIHDQHDPSRWIDVKPIPNTYVVNLGDMLQRWTNDRYRSTVHRVVTTTMEDRYSIPFFFDPNFDCVVSCLPTCCDVHHPPKYEPITSGQYLLDKYAQTYK